MKKQFFYYSHKYQVGKTYAAGRTNSFNLDVGDGGARFTLQSAVLSVYMF